MSKLDDLQIVELDILTKFKDIADRLNLRWYAMFGTLLGASRYNGFIPWDNDIDIALPRSDYDKLCDLAHLFDEPYFLQTPSNDPAAASYIVRLRRTDTTVINKNVFPGPFTKGGHMGACIDIIPLDIVPDQPTAVSLQRMAHTINRQMFASAALDENSGEEVPDEKENICIADGGMAGYYDFFADRYKRYCAKYNEGYYYAMPTLHGSRGNCVFDRKWFDGNALMDFEGIQIPVPSKWNEVLIASYPGGLYEPLPRFRNPKYGENFFVDTNNSYKKYTARYTDMLCGIENKKVYLFGAGDSLRLWLERYGKDLDILYAFDNSESKWGSSAYGVKVLNPDELKNLHGEHSRLIIVSLYYKEISKQLDNMGIKDYFVFIDGIKYT